MGRNVYQASSALADTDVVAVVVVAAAFVVEPFVVAEVDVVEVQELLLQQPDGIGFCYAFGGVEQH